MSFVCHVVSRSLCVVVAMSVTFASLARADATGVGVEPCAHLETEGRRVIGVASSIPGDANYGVVTRIAMVDATELEKADSREGAEQVVSASPWVESSAHPKCAKKLQHAVNQATNPDADSSTFVFGGFFVGVFMLFGFLGYYGGW